MTLIGFRDEVTMLTPMYKRKIVNLIVATMLVFISANPWRIRLNMLVAMRTLDGNRAFVQKKEKQAEHESESNDIANNKREEVLQNKN